MRRRDVLVGTAFGAGIAVLPAESSFHRDAKKVELVSGDRNPERFSGASPEPGTFALVVDNHCVSFRFDPYFMEKGGLEYVSTVLVEAVTVLNTVRK